MGEATHTIPLLGSDSTGLDKVKVRAAWLTCLFRLAVPSLGTTTAAQSKSAPCVHAFDTRACCNRSPCLHCTRERFDSPQCEQHQRRQLVVWQQLHSLAHKLLCCALACERRPPSPDKCYHIHGSSATPARRLDLRQTHFDCCRWCAAGCSQVSCCWWCLTLTGMKNITVVSEDYEVSLHDPHEFSVQQQVCCCSFTKTKASSPGTIAHNHFYTK